MLTAIKDWLGFGAQGELAHAHSGHGHPGAAGGHGHTHGVIDPSLSSNERGIWAIKCSFVILAVTSASPASRRVLVGKRRPLGRHRSQYR